MRSLKLKLEELSVESFAVEAAPRAAGTVRGHESVDDGGEEPGGGTNEARTCFYTQCGNSCYSCPTGLGPNCCV
jgi:hypothetical protein